MAGLSISLALAVTQSLNWSVRMASDLESQMVSVERVIEYASLEQEHPHVMPNDPPPEWPTSGILLIIITNSITVVIIMIRCNGI